MEQVQVERSNCLKGVQTRFESLKGGLAVHPFLKGGRLAKRGVLPLLFLQKGGLPVLFLTKRVVIFAYRFVPNCTEKCTKTPVA